MTIDQALGSPEPTLAVWDESGAENAWLGIFRVGDDGAHLLAYRRMPGEQREPVTDDLRRRRVRLGATCGSAPWVWAADDSGFALWSLERLEAASAGSDLRLPSGPVLRETVIAVTSFLPADDLGHRGVRLELQDGSARVLAEEHDPAAELDPTYDRCNVMIDAFWAWRLARDLSRWLGVSHHDELP